MLSRRRFLQVSAAASGLFAVRPLFSRANETAAGDKTAFFIVSDTHYLADAEKPEMLDATSRDTNARLIDWLNRLPGTDIATDAGGGKVAAVKGVIHGGDLIDSGDKSGPKFEAMQRTEWAAWEADYGLNGGDGRLALPVREVFGNHDAPHGKGIVLDGIAERNKTRSGLTKVSENGLHYSWNWGDVHFVNLGITVGDTKTVDRVRRYASMGSLDFLIQDLAEHVGTSGKPVVLTHHVDVARYCVPLEDESRALKDEWDFADVAAYHAALRNYRVAAILYGHTHARRVFAWDGSPPKAATKEVRATGIPTFNTDNAGHFKSKTQAFFYFEVSAKEVTAREFATTDEWRTGEWTPEVWRFPC